MYVTRRPTSLAFTRKCCHCALRALSLGTRSTNDRFRSRRGFPCSTVGDLELCSRKGHRLSRVTCRASAKPASRTVRGGPDPCWRLRVGWMPHAACALNLPCGGPQICDASCIMKREKEVWHGERDHSVVVEWGILYAGRTVNPGLRTRRCRQSSRPVDPGAAVLWAQFGLALGGHSSGIKKHGENGSDPSPDPQQTPRTLMEKNVASCPDPFCTAN